MKTDSDYRLVWQDGRNGDDDVYGRTEMQVTAVLLDQMDCGGTAVLNCR